MTKKEIVISGCMVIASVGLIVGVSLAQDYGVPKPPTPVYSPPANQTTNATYDTSATANPTSNAAPVKPAVNLTSAENSLQQTMCNAFPTTASQFPSSMYDLGVQLPDNFNDQVTGLGDSLTFGATAMNVYSTYNNKNYFKCFGSRNLFTSGARNCLLNFTASFADGTSEAGFIHITYTGKVTPYVPQNPAPANTQAGDGAAPKNPYAGMDPAPMLSRSACTVTFQKACPVKAGSTLCGQCDVKYAETNLVSKPENLGKCFYCASTQKCTWGAGGLCSSYSCVNKATTKKTTKYFTSCSNCQKSGYYRNYNYNGTNKTTCKNYLRVCRACGSINLKSNCN